MPLLRHKTELEKYPQYSNNKNMLITATIHVPYYADAIVRVYNNLYFLHRLR